MSDTDYTGFYKGSQEVISAAKQQTDALKAEYANPESVLIDDTSSIINDFNAAGGYGILHKEVGETLTILRGLLDKQLNIVI